MDLSETFSRTTRSGQECGITVEWASSTAGSRAKLHQPTLPWPPCPSNPWPYSGVCFFPVLSTLSNVLLLVKFTLLSFKKIELFFRCFLCFLSSSKSAHDLYLAYSYWNGCPFRPYFWYAGTLIYFYNNPLLNWDTR